MLTGVAGRHVASLDFTIEPGVTALIPDASSAAAELVEMVAGVARPRRGTVRIDGADPFRRPDIRARVASLFALERPLEGRTVELAVARVIALRGGRRSARELLDGSGLRGWAERRPSGLSGDENRTLSLALALELERPLVVAAVEPFGAGLERGRVADWLAERGREGACVLCVTASPRDAADLGGRCVALESGGRIREISPLPPVSASGVALELVIRVDDPRKLAALLGAEPLVQSVVWDAERAPGELVVRGPDVEQVSLVVMRAAQTSGVVIISLFGRVPAFALSPRDGASLGGP